VESWSNRIVLSDQFAETEDRFELSFSNDISERFWMSISERAGKGVFDVLSLMRTMALRFQSWLSNSSVSLFRFFYNTLLFLPLTIDVKYFRFQENPI